MTNEEMIAKAVKQKLIGKFNDYGGNVDLDVVEEAIKQQIQALRGSTAAESLASKLQDPKVNPDKQVNQFTSDVIARARRAVYEILDEVICEPEFDPDAFLSAMIYWYEFQQLAKAYGKKALYIQPKGGKK